MKKEIKSLSDEIAYCKETIVDGDILAVIKVKEFIKDIMEGNELELKGHSEGYKDGWSSAISFMMIKIKNGAGKDLT